MDMYFSYVHRISGLENRELKFGKLPTNTSLYSGCEMQVNFAHIKKDETFDLIRVEYKQFMIVFSFWRKENEESKDTWRIPTESPDETVCLRCF